ncbi:MAG: endonuclease/exonuclease/phosphatase family protein [Muribaculaceae bacterium]|nr:endonuclease/exonuclease/phosphatase family protein [Muribaculaceae bacterium]
MFIISPLIRLVLRIVTYVLYAITLISAFGGYVNPGISSIPGALITVFPYFLIATIIAILAWAFTGKLFTAGLGVIVIVLAWGPITTVFPLHFSSSPSEGAKTFKLLTYNILHGDDQEKGNDAPGNRSFEYIIDSGADIVCLQEMFNVHNPKEVHNLDSFEARLDSIYPYQAGDPGTDTKVLSKYPIRQIPSISFFGTASNPIRYTAYTVHIKGRQMTLINMHLNSYALSDTERNLVKDLASVKNSKKGFKELKGPLATKLRNNLIWRWENVRIMREAINNVKGPLIICGDFNDVPASYCYRLLMGDDMKDAYVETSFGPMVTYNRHAFWFHLDQIFYRGPLKALSVKKGNIKSSDHYPLIADFEFTED